MAKKSPRSQILRALREAAQDEGKAVELLERQRWGDDPCCPRCGSVNIYRMTGRDGQREKNYRWRCRDCKRMYSVRTGLIFEETRLPLRVWVYAFWKACSSKKGISALQISRECEISYKSALFLMHRIRYAMRDENPPKLSGTVEADETWIGGKPRYRQRAKWHAGMTRDQWTSKVPVMAMVERGGNIRVRKIERVDAKTLGGAIRECVEPKATIYTDDNRSYRHIGKDANYRHDFVRHFHGEYVRGDVTTNTVEGFFALLKRGIFGTFHSVSKHHLHRYLSEFEFRWNTRKLDDGERTLQAIRQGEGKRLLYQERATLYV
jgi:transposase-like protein